MGPAGAARLIRGQRVRAERNGRKFTATVTGAIEYSELIKEEVVPLQPDDRNVSFRFARPCEIKELVR